MSDTPEQKPLGHRLTSGLNERQSEAVTAPDQSAIILAGAGSGKTKVLTTRIAWLIEQNRTTPEQVLAVTFTNKAAKEMKDRLSKMVNVSVKDMWIGTFHGLCHRMLRENAKMAGLPASFAIMDQDDQLAMIKRILKDEGATLPDDVTPAKLQSFVNKMKEGGFRPGRYTPKSDFEAYAASFYGSYETKCSREGVVDFSELMLRVSELFKNNPEFTAKYQGKFTHIHVDEFQDTNEMQYDWLQAIRGQHGVVFAVGDDDQSIYSFRGSRPENMMDFVKKEAEGRIIRLEQNYRSTRSILNAANALIDKNNGRMGKNLWTDAAIGTKLKVLQFSDDRDEANHIASLLRSKIRAGEDPAQMAILYRSNWQSRTYEKALFAHGVPHVIYGGLRFFERMEVKNAVAYMRLTVNLNDDGAFRRVINMPPRGLGGSAVEQIALIAKEHDIPMLEAAATATDAKLQNKVEGFVTLLADLFQQINTVSLPQFVNHVITQSGLIDQYSKKAEDEERVLNLKEMITAATRYCEESETPNAMTIPAIEMIDEFLASASLDSAADMAKNADNPAGVKEKNPASVILMTVHAAKGLEFDNVVVVGVEQDVFPVGRALEEGNEEEERRLMYVAITRAKKDIFFSSCSTRMVHGEIKELAPSQFIGEIPPELKVEEAHIRPKPASSQQYGGYGGNYKKPGGKYVPR